MVNPLASARPVSPAGRRVGTVICCVLIVVLSGSCASTRGRGFGVGFIAGEPTGISVKNWVSGSSAVDGAVAWSFGRQGNLHIHADYLWHNFNLLSNGGLSFPLYFGLGGRVRVSPDFRIGARIPVGVEYIFKTAPFDVFFELAPLLDLVPESDFWVHAAIGARFFFR